MQSLTRVFRRLYTTKPPERAKTALPEAAALAREASTPLAVRERRARRQPSLKPPPGSDLTATEFSRYQREIAKGELVRRHGKDLSEAEWLDALNERRTRLRGIKKVGEGEGADVRVVGQKIYLPNIIFRMVRNHTPKDQPYNPYEATFRIPQSVTKTDVRSYLSSVYGLKTTYIRTTNYLSPLYRTPTGSRETRSYRTYKRAVVGLVDPFYYPQAMEDMTRLERKERQIWLEQKFALGALKRWRRYELVRVTQQGSRNWRFTGHLRRDKILHEVARRKALANRELEETRLELSQLRAEGKKIPFPSQSKMKARLATN
ncbi:hypothetical protein BJ138DRAFT_1082340 [Hygrophoropsis aurantiaca]|uniref:Uncharacterized protein n=1 Tax=Hygrophoropsis aurantiaca TaxID=72124 RepID=A0ACB8AI69_9AGAM|nr:hypothetical protein BJ138DRAFT_1082340 [Hygrophoropsis aurantiaca]